MAIVIGAGMAGLMAAGILRSDAVEIVEAQPTVPNNHSALLRFRSSVVGDALNIPFKKVTVLKAVAGEMNPVAAALAYSLKTNGTARLRSSISANGELSERYIAPEDLVQRMMERVTCGSKFGFAVNKDFIDRNHHGAVPMISTIPMPYMMNLLGWDNCPEFFSVPGYNVTCRLSDVDAYCTLYIPDRAREENRISITGNKLTIEVSLPKLNEVEVSRIVEAKKNAQWQIHNLIIDAMEMFGLKFGDVKIMDQEIKQQRYSKILPIDESIRRNFILWASEKFGVYSLGRFATWRPGLLLDDVVNDVRVIQNLMRGAGRYDHAKKEM